ncbi:MAG: hypothetical protein EP321_03230 [Sphingomonadales bacterium]|nr:MAG: hypothetical protein EP345_09150 [Sphingomonadales bacterium]TNF05512.1 MAG: hypothetical protein EP321_03230 [Sphingomonadales bacterium]
MKLFDRCLWLLLWLGIIGMAVKGLLVMLVFLAFLGMLNRPRETFGFIALAIAVQFLERYPVISIISLLIGGAITLANRPDRKGTTSNTE